jgi:very-short-patch-repair endonuclease
VAVRLSRNMSEKPAPPDQLIAQIAAQQHGVVSRAQLLSAEIDDDAIFHRVRIGRMHRVHQGVYAIGHKALSDAGVWMAAVLACGAGAVLSHRSAAHLWRLLPTTPGVVDVTAPGGGGRAKRPGVRRHRTRSLANAELTRQHGIPVTTPARTITDLRRVVPPERLRRAIREAEMLGFDLGTSGEPELTRSELEHLFLRLCRRHRLPVPERNAAVGGFTVDFLWQEYSLIVETDGYRYHRGRQAFEDDRARDVELRLLGCEVVRFTYRQVLDEPKRVATILRALLSHGRSDPR